LLREIIIKTRFRSQMLDISREVEKIIRETGFRSGLCCVFVPHTTAGVTINENADPCVIDDILKELNQIVPWEDNYKHLEGNSAAHIKASMMGFSQLIIVEDGRLVLGTWQGIYFCEFDGPRTRRVFVKTMQ